MPQMIDDIWLCLFIVLEDASHTCICPVQVHAAVKTPPPFCPEPHVKPFFFRIVPVPKTPLFSYQRTPPLVEKKNHR